MLFEHMTAPDVEKAVKKGLVAILPLGCIEIHGPHMPIARALIFKYTHLLSGT
jgi:creatinine amidohydrolase/Fe(II)-dependent formamide hydrolase-like protein